MIVVTAGRKYIDIDTYASIIAYTNLLNIKGKRAKGVSYSNLNSSIVSSLKNLSVSLDQYIPSSLDNYVVMDLSNPDYFEDFVNCDRILTIFDHHTGFEDKWLLKLGTESRIEFIGSVATMVFEEYEKEGYLNKISNDIALLLMAAILDNTLNFKAKITSNRDINAYKKLEKISSNHNFSETYFLEYQSEIESNLVEAINNDTKFDVCVSLLPSIFSQMIIWDFEFLINNKEIIINTLNRYGCNWIINFILLKEGVSYILTSNNDVLNDFVKVIGTKKNDDTIIIKKVMLRKEIIKLFREN